MRPLNLDYVTRPAWANRAGLSILLAAVLVAGGMPALYVHYADQKDALQARRKQLERSGQYLAGHTALSKRVDAPGFKIIWRTESHSDAADNAISNNRDVVELASRVAHDIATNWAGDSDYYGLDQWIGTVGISYIVTGIMGTSLRIIPEVNSFGVEYEDVAVCGSLGTP